MIFSVEGGVYIELSSRDQGGWEYLRFFFNNFKERDKS